MSTKSLKYACTIFMCKGRVHWKILSLILLGLLAKNHCMMMSFVASRMANLYFSLGAAPHHSLTKLLDLMVHIKFCLIGFHLHILFTYYVATHYIQIQFCRELITCFNVYFFIYVLRFCTFCFPSFVFFFSLFVPTHFVFFPVSCHCHSDTRMHFAWSSLEHAGR